MVAKEKEIREVQNYFRALLVIDNLSVAPQITPKNIFKIHKTVIDGLVDTSKAGELRTSLVYIANQEHIIYTPPESKKLKELISDLIDWLVKEQDIHPIIRAGLLHYQFVTIHPFTDGNGRTARLLTLLHLYQSGWNFRKSLALDEYYNTDRLNYYKALQTGKTYTERQSAI